MPSTKNRIINMNLGCKSNEKLLEEMAYKKERYHWHANLFASYLGGNDLLTAVRGLSFDYSLSAEAPNLHVILPRDGAKNGIRKVVITLNADDYLNVECFKCWMDNFTYREELISRFEGMGDDNLLALFQSETDLAVGVTPKQKG